MPDPIDGSSYDIMSDLMTFLSYKFTFIHNSDMSQLIRDLINDNFYK